MTSMHRLNTHPARTGTPPGPTATDQTTVDLAVLNLDDTGLIRDCSQSCAQLFGYRPDELVGNRVSSLLPQLPEQGLVQDGRIHARLAYLCHCGIAFQARHRDGRYFPSELFINRLDAHNVVVLVRVLASAQSVSLTRPIH